MEYGLIKVVSATPKIKVADVDYNLKSICEIIKRANTDGANLLVLPELTITGYSCFDLFYQKPLLDKAINSLFEIAKKSKSYNMIIVVGLPVLKDTKLYNAAAVIFKGEILGIIPKTNLPNYGESCEKRYFTKAPCQNSTILLKDKSVPFGTKLLFKDKNLPEFCLGVEICEDLWALEPVSTLLVKNGATIIANCSASNELVTKDKYRMSLVVGQSARLISGYIYSSAGSGESRGRRAGQAGRGGKS